MNLEEQIKNAIIFFLNYPRESGQKEARISAQVLKENGLDNDTFWKVIYPLLKKEGALYSQLLQTEISDDNRYNIIWNKLENNKNKQNKLSYQTEHGLIYSDKEKEKVLKQQEQELNEELALVSTTTYPFEINQEKLEKIYSKYNEHRQQNNIEINIVLNSENNTLIINSEIIFFAKETLERVMIDALVEKKTEISWDEILDIFDGDCGNEKIQNPSRKREVGDARNRINRKVKKTDLKEDLISRRENNYALKREVVKR